MKWMFTGLLFLTAPACATEIYKCQSGKSISTQSQPCPPGSTTIWKRTYDSAAPRSNGYPSANLYRPSESGRTQAWSGSGSPSSTQQKDAQCEAAKQREAAYRQQRGLKITFDELRQLGDMVRAACS